jgi:hypothetical protein
LNPFSTSKILFHFERRVIMKTKNILLGLCIVLLGATFSGAVPTEITVRVKTKDAKFLGNLMGGASVSIKDAQTGELLAKGLTTGGTGNTGRIMKTPVARGVPISDESAAKFTATIDINEPRLIEVTAYGPLVNLQAANKVSATQWVVPGKHITGGDAWMLELPGFVVDVIAPPAPATLKGVPQDVTIKANVVMM